MPLHAHKIGSTHKIEMQFLNIELQRGKVLFFFSAQNLTLNFSLFLGHLFILTVNVRVRRCQRQTETEANNQHE